MHDSTNQPAPDSGFPLKTLSESGKAPKSRLCDAKDAQDIFWLMHKAAEARVSKAAVIDGMFDGNPPYDGTKLKQHGQSWRSNFNTLEGASRKDSAKVPYYDLFSSASLYADCQTTVTTDKVDAAAASRIRSEEFDKMIRGWRNFEHQVWTMLDDFIAFNRGFFWFPRPDSWHFKHIPWNRIYFPDGTGYDIDDWELFAVEHTWPVHRLYRFIRDPEAAREAGWNVDQVIKAIRMASPRLSRDAFDDPMEFQRALANHEIYESLKSNTVHAASIYVREFDGSWSRMMVQADTLPGQSSSGSGKPTSRVERGGDDDEGPRKSKLKSSDWLFFKNGVGESITEILSTFIFECNGNGINALEGMGKRIVSAMQLKDRLRNSQADNVLLRNTVLMQPATASGTMKTGLIQIGGGVTVLPPGFNVQNSTILGDLEGGLAVNNDLDRMLDTNTGVYRPQFEKPQGNPESATAASIRASQATILTNSAVNRFYQQLDYFFDEMYRRASMEDLPDDTTDTAIEAAKEFQKRCKDRGLEKGQITDRQPGMIRAMRTIGNGSPVMRQQIAGALGQLVPFLGPRGVEAWKEMFAASYVGQHAVQRLLPKEDKLNVPGRDDWDATSENADMQQGAQVIITESQNHEIHAQRHLEAGFAAVSAVQEGADPTSAYIFLQQAIPHAQQHIGQIGREGVRKKLAEALQQLTEGFRIVEQAVKQRQQQQEQASQFSFEQQMKMQETQSKLQERDAKTEQQLRHKEQRFQQQQQLSDAQVASNISRQNIQTAANIELQERKTETAERGKE